MTATYNIVTLGSNDYEVYADVPTADAYLDADSNASGWREAEEDEKARALVSATRVLDRQRWSGSQTETDQDHAWPRTGVSGVDSEAIPQEIIDATCELASAIVNGFDAFNTTTTASSIKRQKAGSVEIENFRGVGGKGTRLPLPVHELIRSLLGGGSGVSGGFASGTCAGSITDQDFGKTTGQ